MSSVVISWHHRFLRPTSSLVHIWDAFNLLDFFAVRGYVIRGNVNLLDLFVVQGALPLGSRPSTMNLIKANWAGNDCSRSCMFVE